MGKKLETYFCVPNTINNPIKAYFFNKKYPVTTQTRKTQIVNRIYLIEKPVLT